jgi:hypothetical protein
MKNYLKICTQHSHRYKNLGYTYSICPSATVGQIFVFPVMRRESITHLKNFTTNLVPSEMACLVSQQDMVDVFPRMKWSFLFFEYVARLDASVAMHLKCHS